MTRLTDNSLRREPSSNVTVAISMAVYGMALCGVMLLIGLYHYRNKSSLGQFLLSPSVILCLVAVLGLLVASGVLVRFLCGSQGRNRDRRYAVVMSLLVIVLVGGIVKPLFASQLLRGTTVLLWVSFVCFPASGESLLIGSERCWH